MPRQDKTGPQGQGAMTGRRLGYCRTTDTQQNSSGFYGGYGRGGRMRNNNERKFINKNNFSQTTLLQEKELLQRELNRINQELDSIKDLK